MSMSTAPPTPLPGSQRISGTNTTNGSQAAVGIFHGNVTFGNTVAPPPSQEPPKPASTVPFRRDLDFVDRSDILERVEEACSQPAGRVALVGLGGVGKSQLAIEFAHRVRDRSPGTWVFWVFASNAARVEAAYKIIADTLVLPGRDEHSVNIVGLVTRWLANESNGPWLMIIDNVDDLETLHARVGSSEEAASIANMIPQSCNGAVLVTSRNADVARQIVDREQDIIRVGQMKKDEAADLLKKKLEKPLDGSEASLLAELDHFPLAIVQAAAYINRQPGMSVSAYVGKLSDIATKTSLLEKHLPNTRRHEKAKSSILKTWVISFEQIKIERPGAAELLSFMSFFNRQGIPKFMFQHSTGYVEGDKTATNGTPLEYDDDEVEEHLAVLYSFSLISTTMKHDEFEMHGLVQFATRAWLKSTGREEDLWGRYLTAMDASFPDGDYEGWAMCQALLPHIQSIGEKSPSSEVHVRAWTQVLTKAGWYTCQQGLLSQARGLIEMSLSTCEQLYGANDHQTLLNLNILAKVLGDQGMYELAEAVIRRVVARCEEKRGEDHLDTLNCMSDLATILRDQGKYKESEETNRRVLLRSEEKLGEDHLNTLTSMSNLALILRDQGKFKEAEEMNRRVLLRREEKLGEDHPRTLTSISNLASVLKDQGEYKDSEDMTRRVLLRREVTLGEYHPETLMSMNNLAFILHHQGRYKESEELNRRVLLRSEEKLGEEHPQTLTSMSNLAQVLELLHCYDEATSLYERACSGFQRRLGDSHPQTVVCRDYLQDILSTLRGLEKEEV